MQKTYTNEQIDSAMRTMVVNNTPWSLCNEVQRYCVLNVPSQFVSIHNSRSRCVFRINPLSPGPYMPQPKSDLKEYDISDEEYREIVFVDADAVYRIEAPQKLFIRPGGSTHRVVDAEGVAHCYPAPEDMGLTVIRWKTKDAAKPVTF